jgi:hypothetical protein
MPASPHTVFRLGVDLEPFYAAKPRMPSVIPVRAVSSTNPLQSGIGQIDDLAIWSRALAPPEVLRVFAEGISESSDLSLFYDFNEGTGSFAKNKGSAGSKYDLVLGRSDAGGPTAYQAANKYGGFDQFPFTQPVWALRSLPVPAGSYAPVGAHGFGTHSTAPDDQCKAAQLISPGKPQPTGYGGKPFVTLKESAFVQFILEYFHPAGRKSSVSISRPTTHGSLEEVLCASKTCSRTRVVSAPFELSSSPYASLVCCCDCLPNLQFQAPKLMT